MFGAGPNIWGLHAPAASSTSCSDRSFNFSVRRNESLKDNSFLILDFISHQWTSRFTIFLNNLWKVKRQF